MPDVHEPKSDDSQLNGAWQSFNADTLGVPMLEAREVRRLGDRRRVTRRATVAGATLGVAVLACAGVALGTGGFQRTTGPDIAGSPSQDAPTVSAPTIPTSSVAPSQSPTASNSPSASSSSASSASAPASQASSPASTTPPVVKGAITTANLPTNREIYRQTPGDVIKPLVMDGISTASGEPNYWICENGLTRQPGIVAAKSAIFTEGGNGTFSRAHVLQMDSAASATKLADTIRGWNDSCPSRVTGYKDAPAKVSNEPTTTVGGARVDFSVQEVVVDDQQAVWNGMLVIVSGNRVLIIGDFVRGQDYNSVGPYEHSKDAALPLVPTARELDTIIQRLNA